MARMHSMFMALAALGLAFGLTACKPAQSAEAEPRSAAAKPGDANSRAGTQAELGSDGFPAGPYADRDPGLAKQLVDGGALLLDVRSPAEFGAGHVDGAINIPHHEVPDRLDEIREKQGGDAHRPIVVYCRSGRRSGIAKESLADAGFDRVTNLGGLSDWCEDC